MFTSITGFVLQSLQETDDEDLGWNMLITCAAKNVSFPFIFVPKGCSISILFTL